MDHTALCRPYIQTIIETSIKEYAECHSIPHICHLDHLYIGGEKIGHVEKFQISIHDRCGEI